MTWVYNIASPDPKSEVPRVVAICVVFPVLALLAVAFRFFVRIRLKRTPWFDDYAVLSSALLVAAYGAVAIAQTRYGLGLHAEYFPEANVIPFGKLQYAGGPLYTLALLGFKVSLLTAYIRIGGFVQTYNTVLIVAIVAVVCNQLMFTLLLLFACRPIAKQWDQSLPGTCINTVESYYALAGTSIGFDLLIIALPIPVLLNLQLRRRQKIALVFIFALGFFVTIIQVIRIFTVKNLKTYTDSKPIIIWSAVEISIAVITASIPTYAPFFRAFASNLTSRNNTASNTASNSRSRQKAYGLASKMSGSKTSGPRGGKRSHADTATGTDTISGSNVHSQLNDEYDLEILDDGTTINKGSGYSATIMSTSMTKEQRGRESDSEELIPDRGFGHGHGQGHGDGHGHGGQGDGQGHGGQGDGQGYGGQGDGDGDGDDELHTPTTRAEDPFHIHTLTEVTVERHDV